MNRNWASSRPEIALVVWTLFVWASRLRLVLTNDDLGGWDTTWRVGIVVLFTALGLAAGWGVVRQPAWAWPAMRALAVWSVGYWAVRGTAIMLDDHETSFLIVHAVLMIVSIGLAMWVWVRHSR